jgi:thioredoxin-related protein
LKRFLIILLAFLILSPSLGTLFVYASFKINQKEIAQTICVQRKQVFNSCNGRCELQKSIKKYTDNEKEMQDTLKDKIELVYIQNNADAGFGIISSFETKEISFELFENKPIGVPNLTFRPPASFLQG